MGREALPASRFRHLKETNLPGVFFTLLPTSRGDFRCFGQNGVLGRVSFGFGRRPGAKRHVGIADAPDIAASTRMVVDGEASKPNAGQMAGSTTNDTIRMGVCFAAVGLLLNPR